MPSEPDVLVVVVAHDRLRFLPRALISLTKQTLSASLFETVIVSNVSSPEVCALADSLNARLLLSDTRCEGGKLYEALRESSAPIVTILEDDDAFYPEKLQHVRARLLDSPEVVYLHHGWRVLQDKQAAPVLEAERDQDLTEVRVRGNRPDLPLSSVGGIRVPYFNASSVAFRRSILKAHLTELREVNLILDLFLFFAALASGSDMLFSRRTLTGVGIGTENVSLGNGGSASSRRNALLDYSLAVIGLHSLIRSVARRSAHSSDLQLATASEGVQRAVSYLRGQPGSRRELYRCGLELVRSGSTMFVKDHWQAVPLTLLGAWSPGIPSGLYWRIREAVPFGPRP